MGHYPAFICENGHCLESLSHSCTDRFCSKCGAPVISKCPNCGSTIRGRSDGSYGFMVEYTVPGYCRDCGKPYPWIDAAIQATVDLLAEDDSMSDKDREKLIEILPDAVTETPRSQLATARIKKALASLGNFAAEGLKQFLLDFGCEIVKQQLGL